MRSLHIFPFKSLFFIIILSFFFTSCGDNGLFSLNGGSVIHVGKVTVGFTPNLIGGKDYKFLNTSVNNIGSESGIQYIWDFGDGSASVTKTDKSPFTYRFPEFSTKYLVSLTARSSSGNNLGVAQYLVITGVPSSSGVTVTASFEVSSSSGKDFTFKNTTTLTGISEGELQYIWNFGDGLGDILGTDKIISHTFPSFSTKYLVSLTVKNSMGQLLGFSSKEVTTDREPTPGVKVTAKFDAAPVTASKNVAFTNETVLLGIGEGDVKYVWDFGDGSATVTKTDKVNFTHTYPSFSTKYTVMLKVIENATGGTLSSVTRDVTTESDPAPAPSATANFTTVVSGNIITFKNTSILTAIADGDVKYVWNFGDGITETKTDKANFTHTFLSFSTKYTVTLRVEKVLDGSLLDDVSIEIWTGADPLVPSATAGFSVVTTSGKGITFRNTSTLRNITEAEVKYIWNFGDGSGNITKTDKANFTHTFPAFSRTYTVTLQVEKLDGIVLGSLASFAVTTGVDPIVPSAAANFTWVNSGKNITFTNTSTLTAITEGDVKYVWDFGDGSGNIIKTDKLAFTHTFPSFSTKYNVILRVVKALDSGVLGTRVIEVTTGADPTPPPSANAIFSTLNISGKAVTFSNTSTLTSITEADVKYVWDFGDGSGNITKTDKVNFIHTFPAFSRTYTVTLRVEKVLDSSVLGTRSINVVTGVDPTPPPSANAIFSTLNISGKAVTFRNTSTLTSITEGEVEYVWNFGDGSGDVRKTGKLDFIYTFPAFSRAYRVTLQVKKLDGTVLSSSAYLDITTDTEPVAPSATANFTWVTNSNIITFTNTSILMAIGEGGVKYIWNFGDGSAAVTKTDKLDFFHTFPSFSTKYTVTLRVEKVLDSSLLGTRSIEVTTGADPAVPPATTVNADFTYSLPDFYNKSMTFTNTSSPVPAGLQYIWEFGDTVTETKTDITPFTHTYSAIGTYNVKLTVKDSSGVIKGGPITKTVSLGLFDTISTGTNHTLGLTPDGRLYSWGRNRYDGGGGQLGLNDEIDRDSPTEVTTLNNEKIVSIAAGSSHSLALTDDGKVYAWGDNYYGQLGMGSGVSKSIIPKEVTWFSGKKIKSIIAGDNHNFAIADDYTVYAWGSNSASQMGLGSSERDKTFKTPIVHTELSGKKIKFMAASNEFSFAVTETGSLYSWGLNDSGNLGLGIGLTPGAGKYKDTPTLVTDINGVASLAVGASHTIALTDARKVYIWGSHGYYGQLGLGSPGSPQTYPKPLSFPGGATIAVVGVGNNFSFAVSDTGKVYSWGENLSGQLGLNNTTNQFTPVEIIFPFGGKSIKTISGGSGHTIAVNSDGIGYSWGFNFVGQLGLGHKSDQYAPQEMKK